MAIRTDLALEAKQLWERDAENTTQLRGVRAREDGNFTLVEILDQEGARALGKPVGNYLTMELPKGSWDIRTQVEQLADKLRQRIPLAQGESVLVVGLGNPAITPDALGPQSVSKLFVTRHLIQALPQQFGTCRTVSAVTPDVLANTGIESVELVRGVLEHVRPSCILCIDALAAGSVGRLCNTVQFTDTGIAPGSGVGNRRAAFSQESLGLPVYAIGVPTVVDAGEGEEMIVTPRDMDARLRALSSLLAGAINLVLQPNLDYEDFVQFMPILA